MAMLQLPAICAITGFCLTKFILGTGLDTVLG
jgi:hypothetical protein